MGKKLSDAENKVMKLVTDIEILTIRTEQQLNGYGSDLTLCDSWQSIKLGFDNAIRSAKINNLIGEKNELL